MKPEHFGGLCRGVITSFPLPSTAGKSGWAQALSGETGESEHVLSPECGTHEPRHLTLHSPNDPGSSLISFSEGQVEERDPELEGGRVWTGL